MQAYKSGQLPFDGLKFCATSVPTDIKRDITEKIIIMGGSVSNHLMEDTNILIVGMTNTEKYRYCAQKRYNIKYVSPSSIITIYEEWMNARRTNYLIEDNDLNDVMKNDDSAVLDRYSLLPFEGMVICLSRLSKSANPLYRKDHITLLIEQNGGKVTESLTISNTIVITLETSGKRYDKAREWDIPSVHPKWVLDSIIRGAVLEFRFYDISKSQGGDETEIGKHAFLYWEKFESKRKEIYQLDISMEEKGALVPEANQGLVFKNKRFATHGFTEIQLQKLQRVIEQNGGELVLPQENRIDYLIVPSSTTYSSIPSELISSTKQMGLKVVTEWFVERSLFYKLIKLDSWSIPRKHTHLDFGFKISISGFSGIELLHLTRLIESLGCELCETFNEKCNLLVVNLSTINVTRENRPVLFSYKFNDILDIEVPETHSRKNTIDKINASKEWNIPIVSIAFLWEMAERGSLPNLLEYRWCIFGPKSSKGLTDRRDNEDDSGEDANVYVEEEQDPESNVLSASVYRKEDDIVPKPLLDPDSNPNSITVKLPSPRKNKSKRWPRLVGTAAESQLPSTSSLMSMDKSKRNLSNRLHYENAVADLPVENNSQVSYAIDEYPAPPRKRVRQYGKRS